LHCSLKDEAAAASHLLNSGTCGRNGPRRLNWGGSERITQTERGTYVDESWF